MKLSNGNNHIQINQAIYEVVQNVKVTKNTINDRKCIKKEERVRHLPGYCP